MTQFSVYRLTNSINGKVYIGLTTTSVERRWKLHVDAARRSPSKMPILAAINKYGSDAFVVEHIASCRTAEDMHATEIAIIAQERACDGRYGYNVSAGGASGGHGVKRTEAHKRRVADALTGNKHALGITRSPETRARMSLAQKGHPVSEAQRKAIAEKLRNDPAVIARLRQYNERHSGSKQAKLNFAPGFQY